MTTSLPSSPATAAIWHSSLVDLESSTRTIATSGCQWITEFMKTPSRVVPTAAEKGGNFPPSTNSPIIFRYRISQLNHEMKTTGANKRFPGDYSVVQSLHDRVISFLDALPVMIRPSSPYTSWDCRYPYLLRQATLGLGGCKLILPWLTPTTRSF
jgi:hypothetical protein